MMANVQSERYYGYAKLYDLKRRGSILSKYGMHFVRIIGTFAKFGTQAVTYRSVYNIMVLTTT